MIGFIKRLLPAELVVRLKVLNRLRWLTKYRLLRSSGFWRSAPVSALAYLLVDPELESYTYELANVSAMVTLVAETFGVDEQTIASYCSEVDEDPELGRRLNARVRWRPEVKRRLPIGSRLLWHVLVRLRKPELVVETGVLSGLGSLTILRALERNAAEGFPGRLVSVDADPAAGWLVSPELRRRWTLVTGMSTTVLSGALQGEHVAMLFQDSNHEYATQVAEFGLAIERADRPLILVDPDGARSGVLDELCDRCGGSSSMFQPLPQRHFHIPAPIAIGLFPPPASG